MYFCQLAFSENSNQIKQQEKRSSITVVVTELHICEEPSYQCRHQSFISPAAAGWTDVFTELKYTVTFWNSKWQHSSFSNSTSWSSERLMGWRLERSDVYLQLHVDSERKWETNEIDPHIGMLAKREKTGPFTECGLNTKIFVPACVHCAEFVNF